MTERRLPRGTRVDPVRVGWAIERGRKARIDELSLLANVSAAVFLESVIDHLDDEIAANGLPTWWPETTTEDGELPIDSA